MAKREKRSISQRLIEEGMINEEQLKIAEAEASSLGEPLEKILVKKKFIREQD